VRLSSFKKPHC